MDKLLLIPLAVICALDSISIFTGWIFYIDAQGGYQMADWFNLQTIVNYFYLLIPTAYSAYRAVKTHSRQDRAEYWTYTLYMIAPLISGLLEDYLPHVPILALNIFMVILILFLMIQNMQIYNDALTGLNNRRRLNIYLEETLPKATVQRPMLLFMMDIDNFKSINDAYGHIEGDGALKAFSDAMKDVAIRYSAFIARYGGDEFCMVMDASGKLPEAVAEDVRQSLRNTRIKCQTADDSYELMASIGFVICDGTERNPELELARADKMLYEEKAQKARQRTAAI
jgi:diguanylate cyclase (GGDEF)-like protein